MTETDRQEIRALVRQGLYLQAWAGLEKFGPPGRGASVDDLVLVGRVVYPLGAPRRHSTLMYRAYRTDPLHPESQYRHGWTMMLRRGPYFAWQFVRGRPDLAGADAELRASWFALQSCVAGSFRDFDAADDWMARAMDVVPDDPWIWVEKSHLLETEDRPEDALEAARRSLVLRPHFGPAAQMAGHLLALLGRDDEALAVLAEAAARAENSALWAQLAILQTELERYAEASRSLDRYAETTPLREKRETEWLAGVRSDVAYGLGDYEAAARLAEECGSPFHKVVAPRLRQAPADARRVVLPVPLVRQHHKTCGPATLTAISRYWKVDVRHVEVVEQICYDGTSHYDERRWAEDAGYRAREFTVTWDAAVALLDRGVPFTLTSTYPSFAHLQAVAGYDARRGTLLVREPSSRHLVEALGEEALKLQASTGPRGMAMVPTAQAALLDGLALPDADLYDLHYRMSAALRRHDRPEAQRLHAALNDAAPGHRLTHMARLALADYDQDGAARLRQVEGLLRLYPDDPFLLSRKLIAYPEGLSRQERGDLLRKVCDTKDVDAFFMVELAYWLREDGRLLPEALGTLRRAVRHHGHTGPLYYVLGHVLWGLRRVDEAVAVYRLAMCLDDANEALSRTYLAASRHLKQADGAVAFLSRRFVRFGRRSGQPALTLFWAYEQLDLMDKAFAALEGGLALRPDDENLLLAAADDNARYGRFDRADVLLEKARGHSRRTAWLRTAADVARTRGDTTTALDLSQEVLAAEPYATDLHAQVARLLAITKGRAAALSHLRQAVAEFPHSYLLHTTLIEWLRPEDAKEHEAGVRGLLAVYPINAWARRELALALRRERRFDEALSEVGLACVLDPVSPVGPTIRAGIEMAAGRLSAGRESARQAIRMSVDADDAISILIESYTTHADRRQVLDFVKQELIRQVIFGDGLLAYREHARGILGHGELLASLREAVAARPDLWHAWSALASHLTDMGDLDEAERMARATAERFPLLPRVWLDLAHVRRARPDTEGEIEALEKAIQISPHWGHAVRALASAYQRAGRAADARRILERLLAFDPFDVMNHGFLAEVLWKLGEKAAALDRVEQAVRLEPQYAWAWNQCLAWSAELGGTGRAADLARALSVQRPDEANSWLVLARMLKGGDPQERLKALDRAIELAPRDEEAYDLKADLLASCDRVEEALAACRPASWTEGRPARLRSRAAWILAGAGRIDEAVAECKALAEDNPRDYECWRQLSEMYDRAGKMPEMLQAAEQMLKLAPHNAQAMGYVADGLIRNKRQADARPHLEKAFALDPDYSYAGLTLFDLLLEDADRGPAREVLAVLEKQVGGPLVLSRRVQLARRDGDLKEAAAGLRALCEGTTAHEGALEAAIKAMTEAKWTSEMTRILREAATRPEPNPQAGRMVVRHMGATGRDYRDCRNFVVQLLQKGDAGVPAAVEFMEQLVRLKRFSDVRSFIQKQGDALARHVDTWGTAGYALATIQELGQAADWLRDYSSRPGRQPWMLYNLVYALRWLGRMEEAHCVAADALALPPDRTSPRHRAVAALGEALRGNLEAAAAHLALLNVQSMAKEDQFTIALAKALQAAAAKTGRDRDLAVRLALKQATTAVPSWKQERHLRKSFRACLRRLGKVCGGLDGLKWFVMSLYA